MSDTTDRLREVAERATCGPWTNNGGAWGGPWVENAEHYVASGWRTNEAAHIATFDPVLVGAMLDVIDAAEHAAGFAARGQGRTPVLTQQIIAELDASLARFREVAG